MKRLIGILIILASITFGTLIGAAYTQKKLADKFDMVTEMTKEADRLTVGVCRHILQSRTINCVGETCA